MEFDQWEKGWWTMPPSESDRLREIVRSAVDTFAREVLQKAKTLHAELGPEIAAIYGQRLEHAHSPLWVSSTDCMLNTAAKRVLAIALTGLSPEAVVRAPTEHDLALIGLTTTEQTMTFYLFDADADEPPVIKFHESGSVTWDVPYGDRAVEYAHSAPTLCSFLAGLDSIGWGTTGGGALWQGGDDFSDSNCRLSDDGSQVTATHGPLGARIGGLVSEANRLMSEAEALLCC